MAEEILSGLGELASGLPVEVVENISGLVVLLKAVGVVAIIYVIYMIGMGILTFRRMKKVEHIERKADEIGKKVRAIDKKLDKLIDKKG